MSNFSLQRLFRVRHLKTIFALCVLLGLCQLLTSGNRNAIAGDQPQKAATSEKVAPATEITQNITLDPDKVYGQLIIKASNITIDGRGAKIVGAKSGSAKGFQGIGILGDGVSNVTLTNVRVSGWETGLKVVNATGWTISGCDFSGNFHDPDFGWGEQGRRGGIVLERTHKSTLKKNKANQVWDACVLVNSNDNIVSENDFSHTSNTCLKLWTSCRNTFSKNMLSYGIRISPGEVHARDSTSVLIESGSNDNRFLNNDCTYGGDGIFIRVLNGWVSTGNYFEGNDCSYANNNGFECWAPRNVFVKNKANHSSYGFWMGGSDQSRLIDNEASFNGDLKGHHNSPHLPAAGHAGIVFMFGPGSHCVARGNTCIGNNGAGIAIIGDLDTKGQKWKAFHWIVEQNTLTKNRWGIYLNYADWIEVSANDLRENTQKEIFDAGGVTRLQVRSTGQAEDELKRLRSLSPPVANLSGPQSAIIGQLVQFDAQASRDPANGELKFSWDLGDGTLDSVPHLQHAFKTSGFHRMGLTVSNGTLSDLAWRDFYVVEDLPELATEGQADHWGSINEPNLKIRYQDDSATKLAGKCSVHAILDPYHGARASLLFPTSQPANWSLQGKTHLVFWLKTINPNMAWQDANPLIKLYSSESEGLSLTPKKDLLNQPSFNEAREGWKYFEIPLAGDTQWQRDGTDVKALHHLTIGVDSWDAQPLELWIDGLAFKTK